MTSLDWTWLRWQFFLPVCGPAAVTGFVLGSAWLSGQPIRQGALDVFDMSPWALVTYALTLSAISLRDRWTDHPAKLGFYFVALNCATAANLLYYAVIVLRRKDADFSLGGSYAGAILLTAGSLYLCYKLRRIPEAIDHEHRRAD